METGGRDLQYMQMDLPISLDTRHRPASEVAAIVVSYTWIEYCKAILMLSESGGPFDSTRSPKCYNSLNITTHDLTRSWFSSKKTRKTKPLACIHPTATSSLYPVFLIIMYNGVARYHPAFCFNTLSDKVI